MDGKHLDGLILGVGLGLLGCGGRVAIDDGEVGGGATGGAGLEQPAPVGEGGASAKPGGAGAPAEPPPASGGGRAGAEAAGGAPSEPSPPGEGGRANPDPDGEGACSAAPAALRAELMWSQTVEQPYGVLGHGDFAYSPDGLRLVTPADQYVLDGYTVYRASDGSLLESVQHGLLGRNRLWTYELRTNIDYPYFRELGVVDLATDTAALRFEEIPAAARLSATGDYVTALYCGATPRIERLGVGRNERTEIGFVTQANPCDVPAFKDYSSVKSGIMASSSTGSSLAYTIDGRNRVAVVDLESQEFSELSLGPSDAEDVQPGVRPQADGIVTMAFSPGDGLLAAVASRTLRIVHSGSLTQALPDLPAGVTTAFTNCYCEPRYFSPFAWSNDERYFAATDPDLAVAIRRSCDGALLARIENTPAEAGDIHDTPGPAFVAFSPNGTHLAVYATERRTAKISVYRLGE